MDYKESRNIFVRKILEAIPPEAKPVDYLMDILHLSRVSVYRRINCEVPFTYDEMFILIPALNLSLEEFFGKNKNNKTMFFNGGSESDVCDFFYDILNASYDNFTRISLHSNNEIIISLNHLWLLFTFLHKNLFRFYYYKWIHTCSVSFDTPFYEIEIPDKLLGMIYKIKNLKPTYKNISFILDRNVFLNAMIEIQYYYRRKLITTDDLRLITDDLRDIINVTYKRFREENMISYYLSFLPLYSNNLYISNDSGLRSVFGEHYIKPQETTDINICVPHKKWLEYMKNYSIMISGSNEALQMDFIRRQREYLDFLIEDKELSIL